MYLPRAMAAFLDTVFLHPPMLMRRCPRGKTAGNYKFNVDDFAAARRFALPVLTPASFLQQLIKENE